MAKFDLFAKRLLNIEGGYVNHPSDKGGPTKYGVILSTWIEYGYDKNDDGKIDLNDIKLLTPDDARFIAKRIFWDFFKADKIQNQSIADFIVDWGYNSGRSTVAKKIQQILKVKADGFFGAETLAAINHADQRTLFEIIKETRRLFLEHLVAVKPSQMAFYNGWMNRLDRFFFAPQQDLQV